MADLEDTILDVAGNPKRLKGDVGEVEEHSIAELLEADRYLREQTTRAAGKSPVRFQKITGPSPVL